jgi:cytochrome c peroxidase
MGRSNKKVHATSESKSGFSGWCGRGAALALAATVLAPAACSKDTDVFSAEEWERVKMIAPFSTPMPRNPFNAEDQNPDIGHFGQKLFFDGAIAEAITVAGPSGNVGDVGKVSCFTCHGSTYFADARPFPQSHGRTGWLAHNTPAMVNLGYQDWTFWTGRFTSMAEHGAVALGGSASNLAAAHYVYKKYKDEYNALFPATPLPDALDPAAPDAARFPATGNLKANGPAADGPFDRMTRADQWAIHTFRGNIGYVFDTYPRMLNTKNSPFQKYVEGMRDDKVFNGRARNGLKLFIGKASCIDCHNGPVLSDNKFHNVGVPDLTALPTGSTTSVAPDRGRGSVMITAFNNAIFLNRTNRMIPEKTDQWPVFSAAGQFSADPELGLKRLTDEDEKYCIERKPEANAATCAVLFKAPKPDATPPDAGDPRYQICLDANADHVACTKYDPSQEGVFRTPPLVSIAMTGPYFHTGEFRSLRDVVEHYNKGGGAEGTFVGTKSPRLRPLLLTENEIDDLVEFLKSLTGEPPPDEWTCNPLIDKALDPTMRGCGPPGANPNTGGASGMAGSSGSAGRGAGGTTGAGGMGGTGARGGGAGGMTVPGTGGMAASTGGAPASGGASGTGGAAGGAGGGG